MHHFAGRGVGGEAAAVDPVNPADRCGEEPKMHRWAHMEPFLFGLG